MNYGFALDVNDENQSCLWFTLPPSDPMVQMKLRLLASGKVHVTAGQPRRFQLPVEYTADSTRECFSFLRFVHAKDSELLLLTSNEKFDVKKIDPLSLRNEREVLADLALAAETSMSQFECSLEEDERLLSSNDLSSNVRNAILMRRGEKQVLTFYIGLASAVQPILDMPKKEFKKFIQRRATGGKGIYDNYIDSVLIPLIRLEYQ